MSHDTHVVGIDPGLVHTGLVSMYFEPKRHEIEVKHSVIAGKPDVTEALQFIDMHGANDCDTVTFIEGYRPRSHLNTDAKMVAAVNEYHKGVKGSTVLNNTGVKQVVTPMLMEMLGVWKFTTVTHHQDLRSAARIAILGMLKDDDMNALLTTVVQAALAGAPWETYG